MKRDYLKKISDIINVVLLFLLLFSISLSVFTWIMWGEVSLPQILFFVFNGGNAGVASLFYKVTFFVLFAPLVVSVCLIWFFNKTYHGKNLFCNPYLLLYSFAIICVYLYKFVGIDKSTGVIYVLYLVYFVNLWRNYSRLNTFCSIILSVPLVFVSMKSFGLEKLVLSCFEYEETVFYEEKYKYIGNTLFDKDKKRNVILIFAESFENRFSQVFVDNQLYRVMDKDAVKFDDLTEGYSQNWTQAALFSAFTGTHIHYLSDFYRYRLGDIRPYYEEDECLIVANKAGEFFDFNTPNIRYLGDITKENGYVNIFVQAGDTKFSGTDKLLLKHGFDKENVYDLETFKKFVDPRIRRDWWGVPDVLVFEAFKDKLEKIDKNQPFLGVLFTIELHAGDNPYYPDEKMQSFVTIMNLNNFIAWFKRQDFYENTTLIIVGDHKKMGKDVRPGGGIYNAFFNLPERMKKNLNTNRTFNQIDLFPTILEIMGADIKDHKAGMGTSLFSDKKTLAEEFSYEEQEGIFSKIDRFYQKLWEAKELLVKNFAPKDVFIAHAGGGIDGKIYTNSLEAMEASEKRGYKYIELDMIATGTPPNDIIATHDCNMLFNMLGKKGSCNLDSVDVEKNKIWDKYTLLDSAKILDFFLKHKDLWLVTDKIDNLELLNEKFSELKNRMIVEVFSLKKYKEAKELGFGGVAYNIKNAKDVDVVFDYGISMVTLSLNWGENNIEKLMELKKKGVKILGYSAKNFEEVKSNLEYVDMFYYDGEENLKEFGK